LSGKISELATLVEVGDQQADFIAAVTRFVAKTPRPLGANAPGSAALVEAK